jgi:hypothetical protein
MAALCSISIRQLERSWLSISTKPPIACIREVRCEQARQLIAKDGPTKLLRPNHVSRTSHIYAMSSRELLRSSSSQFRANLPEAKKCRVFTIMSRFYNSLRLYASGDGMKILS